ncbi:MAG TPA: DUF3761 domain-containing protein [Solirubrobacteraceae bacterium]|nr:DUF3761 domain-containing protein [Solirubrobacteraceae bacterium]
MQVALHLNVGSYSLAARSTTISGTVTPGASVRVNGHLVHVRSGRWSRMLALHLGRNHVAVTATMRGRASAGKSIEITRKRSNAELEARRQKAANETPVCTNGTYVNSAGNTVCNPEESPTAPAGATAECEDGTYSFSESRSGTCSHHGGVARWL